MWCSTCPLDVSPTHFLPDKFVGFVFYFFTQFSGYWPMLFCFMHFSWKTKSTIDGELKMRRCENVITENVSSWESTWSTRYIYIYFKILLTRDMILLQLMGMHISSLSYDSAGVKKSMVWSSLKAEKTAFKSLVSYNSQKPFKEITFQIKETYCKWLYWRNSITGAGWLLLTADAGDGFQLVLGPYAAFDRLDRAALIDRREHWVVFLGLGSELARQPVWHSKISACWRAELSFCGLTGGVFTSTSREQLTLRLPDSNFT